MEDFTYHLEGVIKSKEELQDFEGPLNLILMLLSKNKIEIRDIRISEILDQYMAYINEMQSMDLEIASEFVQMASYLVFIKTRTLLEGTEEVSELEALMSSLEQLRCKDAIASVRAIVPELQIKAERGMLLFSTPGETLDKYGEYDIRHEAYELMEALAAMLGRGKVQVEDVSSQVPVPKRIVFGVREKSSQIIDLLRSGRSASLRELFTMSRSKSEVVAVFISVLELCSIGSISLCYNDGDYLITFIGGDPAAALEAITAE